MRINTRDSKRLEKTLKSMAKHGSKFATMQAMNGAAFDARKEAIKNVEKDFINRNPWTKRSIRVNKGNTRDLQASVGSMQEYMAKQELGGTEKATGKHGIAIPTSYSSGEGENARPRRKLPRRPNKLKNINLKNSTGRARGRKAQNVVKVKMAAKKGGNKVIFMNTRKGKGLFRVTGGKRRPKVKMIHDLSRKSITIKRREWLRPATMTAAKKIPKKYKAALLKQIEKASIRNGIPIKR